MRTTALRGLYKMSKVTTFLQLITKDRTRLRQAIDHNFARTKISHLVPDKAFLKMRYRMLFSKKLNLHNPTTFNEKLQWLKLYNRQPNHINMVDKYNVKSLVSKIIGDEYIIPTIAVYDKVEDIDFASLPNKFVLKCTHDSGSTIVCKDKSKFDIEKAKNILNKKLKRNFFYFGREWPYKNVKPRIIAEEFVKDGDNENLPVYKFLCFDGEPKIIQTIQNDKQPNESIDYFDTEWNLLELRQNFPNSEKPFDKPKQLSEMLEIARKLSAGHIFVRVDLYVINEKIKFSEFTFFSDCGFAAFYPEKWDFVLGEWIKLPENS